jgi:hypothetical protein
MTSQQVLAEQIHDSAKQHSLHGWTQLIGSIDLASFQVMSADGRRQLWSIATDSDKLGLVLQILRSKGAQFDSDVILGWLEALEERFGSDAPLPPAATILAVVKDRQQLAMDHGDFAGARQLDRVRANLKNGARMHWSLGDLVIQSVNNPGQVYSVSGRGCTCPNAAARKATCWHVAAYDLLLDMQADRADIADELGLEPAAEHERSVYAHDPCSHCGASGRRPDDLCYCGGAPGSATYNVITIEQRGAPALDVRALGERITAARRALTIADSR